MDFHALPRRDLQALCKRNGVRANMTNAAMADALRALPAVDGIEEYVKQPVELPTEAVKAVADDPQEKQGSPLPRGRRIAVKSPESIRREDGEKEEEEDLKRDADEEKAPALGMGRRGPSRRARAAPVVAPTTTRRAAATSKNESGDVAAEAVKAPTTRRRIQTTVAVVAEEKVPRARRTTRRAAARKTGMQQEEEEEKPQGVVSDVETVTALPVSDEGCDDSEEVEDETNPRNEEESGQEDEAVVSDAVLATVSDEVCDDAEGVVSDAETVTALPVSDEVCDDAEGVVSDAETVTALPVSDEACDDSEEVEDETNPRNEEESGQEDEGETHAVVSDAVLATVSDEVCDGAEDVKEATKLQNEDEEVVMDTPAPVEEEPPVVEECKDKSAVQEPQIDVQQCAAPLPSQEDLLILGLVGQEGGAAFSDGMGSGEGPLDEEMSDCASKDMEIVPVIELPQATLTAGETTEEVGFTGDAGHANDEENEVAAFSELLQHGTAEVNDARMEDSFLFEEKEDVTVDEVLNYQADDTVLDFSGKISPAVEEEGVVSADEMPQSSVAMDEDADEDDFDSEICRGDEQKEVVTVENVLQVSVIDNEVVGNEKVFSSDTPLEFDSAGDLGDRISSPLFADMLDNVTKSMSNNVIAGEPTVSEAEGVSQCMHSSSNEKRSTKLVAVEENEVKDENLNKETLVLTKLSLRKLRAKLKETLFAHKRKEAKRRVALARLDENVC